MSEEEKLSAGLKPFLAKDKRQTPSPSLSCTHTDKQEEKLSGAQSITVHISSELSEIVSGTGPAGVQTQKGFQKQILSWCIPCIPVQPKAICGTGERRLIHDDI